MKTMDYGNEWIWAILAGSLFTTIFLICLHIRRNGETKPRIPIRTMLILGSGGHTKEMLSLSESLPINIYSPRIYIHSVNDELSRLKAQTMEQNVKMCDDNAYQILSIPRSREVGQGWISSVFTTLYSIYKSIHVFYICHPTLIICNGPGVCIPICLIAYFLKITRIYDSKIVYVESLCRVKSLSLSGRIAKHIVDKFLIQSEELAKHNPDALYVGRIT